MEHKALIFLGLQITTFIFTLIYCRYISFYNKEEFLSENQIWLLLFSFILGPFLYLFYYLLEFIMYLIKKSDSIIEYFAKKADKRRELKILYVTWHMKGSINKTKYLSIGCKNVERIYYYATWGTETRKSIYFIERTGVLSTLDVDSTEMDKK